MVLELAEVLAPQPVERRAVELRLAADVVVDPGLEALALLVVPRVRRHVPVLDEHLVGVPVLDLARQPVAALEDEDPLARRREVPGQRAAAGAAADDDDVEVVRAHPAPPAGPRRLDELVLFPLHPWRPAPVERLRGALLAEEVLGPALERVDAVAAPGHERGVDAEPGRERDLAVELDAVDLGDRGAPADHRHRPLVAIRERLGLSARRSGR